LRGALQLSNRARDEVEPRPDGLDLDEEVTAAAPAEVHGERRGRELEDLAPRAARERRPQLLDDLAYKLFIHRPAHRLTEFRADKKGRGLKAAPLVSFVFASPR
jgi:hypothetical protein